MIPQVAVLVGLGLAGGAVALYVRSRPAQATAPGNQLPVDPLLAPKQPGIDYGDTPLQPVKTEHPLTRKWVGKHTLDDLPVKLAAMVEKMQSDPSWTPQRLQVAADMFRGAGYLATAEALTEQTRRRVEALGGIPYGVQLGDTGAGIAKIYAGDPGRWRELVGRQSSGGLLTSYKDAQGWEQLKPWLVGQLILLPPSWNLAQQKVKP